MADRFGVAPLIPVLSDVPPGAPGFVRVYARGDKVYAVDEVGVETLLTNDGATPPPVVGGGGNVERELLQYDNRSSAKRAVHHVSVPVLSADASRMADETVTAAVLGQAIEVNKRAVEDINAEVLATANEAGQRALESAAMVGSAAEVNRRATDAMQSIIIPGIEIAKRAVETTPLEVMATANEVASRHVEQIESAIVVLENAAKRAIETDQINVALVGYADAVSSNTGWTNPNNVLGNTTGTAATLTATSSGLAGTTNNTTNGTIVLGFRDVNLGDLNINSAVLRVETQRTNAGVAIAQPTSNVQWQYSFDGSSFTTFHSITAVQAKSIQSIDVTALVGQDQGKLSALRIRATGSVTSGSGLGASNTVSFFRAWMEVAASRTYT